MPTRGPLLAPDLAQRTVQGDPALLKPGRSFCSPMAQRPLWPDQAAPGTSTWSSSAEGTRRPRQAPVPASRGVPCLIAWPRTRPARRTPRARLRRRHRGTRGGVLETTFGEETETTCSAAGPCCAAARPNWSSRASRRLVEAGYQPEVAYYECLHELKLIVDCCTRAASPRCTSSSPRPPSTAT